jgi:hypothetical protein
MERNEALGIIAIVAAFGLFTGLCFALNPAYRILL